MLTIVACFCMRDPEPVLSEKNGIFRFVVNVSKSLISVAKSPLILLVSLYGALTFGTMLSLGVIWAPSLVEAHGIEKYTAYLATSMLWIGLAVGSAVFPRWSEKICARRLPNITGTLIQLVTLCSLLYLPSLNGVICIILLFLYGFGNAAHMLAFSGAADIVPPAKIGTSASVVNGMMFIAGGILMGMPGARYEFAALNHFDVMSSAQYALLPLVIALIIAFFITLLCKETHSMKN